MDDSDIEKELALYNKPFEPPQEILNDYPLDFLDGLKLIQTAAIASGGTSDIYLATLKLANSAKTEIVVIKILHGAHCKTELGKLEEYCRRLKREAVHLTKIMQYQQHENIVPFFGFSPWGLIPNSPSPGLVSRFYKNYSVVVYLTGKGQNTPEIRLRLIRDVANGLSYIHGLKMIHGDIKPNNVLVDGKGRAALCDFGQARIMDLPTGYTTALRAVPQYTAPELLKAEESEVSVNSVLANSSNSPKYYTIEDEDRLGRNTTIPADVYAFAMTILEISSGLSPFKITDSKASVVKAVGTGKRPDKKRHEGTYNLDGLWTIIEDCWAEKPQDRPEMTKVVKDLEGVKVAVSSS